MVENMSMKVTKQKWVSLVVSLLITGMTAFYPTYHTVDNNGQSIVGRGLPLVYVETSNQWNYVFLIIDVVIWFIVIYALSIIWNSTKRSKEERITDMK